MVWDLTATFGTFFEQGKGEDGRQPLSQTYETFTEGFDTPDLQRAKAILFR